MKRMLLVAVSCLWLAGCGSGVPRLSSPPEGARYQLGGQQSQFLYATLEDNDYSGVTIQILGDVPQGVACSGGNETQLLCTISPNYLGGGGMMQQRYTAVIKATRGDVEQTRVVIFEYGQPGAGVAPR